VNVFCVVKGKGFSLLPRMGAFLEKAERDRQREASQQENPRVALSGGEQFALNGGLDVFFNRYALSLEARLPLTQSYATGRVEQQSTISMSLLYSF
jgi:hypothetical protein